MTGYYPSTNFIGALGEYPIYDYINDTSNIIQYNSSNFTLATSNILQYNSSNFTTTIGNIVQYNTSNYTFISSNMIMNELKQLIYFKKDINSFNNAINTYIYSSNILGEIRFITIGSPNYFGNTEKFITKIAENGQLMVYYPLNVLFPTVLPGWYSVVDTIRDNYAFQAQTNGLLGSVQIEINGLSAATTALEVIVEKHNLDIVTLNSEVILLNRIHYIRDFETNTHAQLMETIQAAKEMGWFDVFKNPTLTTIGGGSALIGLGAGLIGSILYANHISTQTTILNEINNSNITYAEKQEELLNMSNINIISINNFNSNMSNLNLLQGFINSNITTSQTIPNITTNQITIQGELITEGRIKENNQYLSNVYVSSNQIFKKTDTYSVEQQYPSKLYNTFTTQVSTTFLGQASCQESITLNNTGISYGVGQYDIYVSTSSLASNRAGKQLFNYVLNEEADSCHFTGVYNASGFYVGNADYINSGYYGDWCIIKLPNPIILTKFAFYMRPTQTLRAPSLWKCYGSIDGTTFTEIVEGGNTTALTSGSYTASKYEKILNTTFNIPYNYIGFCYNKITGAGSILNFAEIQIFGKELLETPFYISSNVLQSQNYINSNSIVNILSSYISSNIITTQFIDNLKINTLDVNNGNISNINGIQANEIIAYGKIKENNISLNDIYLTSNFLFNLQYNYTSERQYPPKLYTTSTVENSISFLGNLLYHQTLFLDTNGITYGSGIYEIYSSSSYDTPITKDKLFNYNTSETITSSRWGISQYNSGTGNYQGTSQINNYYGDFIIIKMPQQIILTKYRIYQRSDFLTKAPSLFKVFASNDGIIFTEIVEAGVITRLTSYTSGFYEKNLASTTKYQYFAFVFNALLSTSGQTDLSFSELQIFGKEILNNTVISNIYTTSNAVQNIIMNMPNVSKQNGFYITVATAIGINSITFYKYDIDLRPYTSLGIIDIGPGSGDPYRNFKITIYYGTNFYSVLTNNILEVSDYKIFMSYKAVGSSPGVAGLNIASISSSQFYNPNLDKIPPNNLFLMRNGGNDINYMTVVSRQSANVRVLISDLIG